MPKDIDMFQMLDIVRISRMSQWDRLPSGSKRRSEFSDTERPGSYRLFLPQQTHTSQSSEASTSPHSSQEGQPPQAVGQLPFLKGIPTDVVGTRIDDASFHTSSSMMKLPTPSSTSSAELTLPPIALPPPRPASYTHYSGKVPEKFRKDHTLTQTLQHENTDLASAYSHAQIHIAELDTKVQASQAENEKLVKERQRLTGKIEVLEAQLEELEHSIQQTQKHTAAKDVQYSRIMEQSTRLQSQGAAESQARKAEQYEWSCEKKSMQGVIKSLSNEVYSLRKAYASYASDTTIADSTPLSINDGLEGHLGSAAEPSSHGLIAEMEALRHTNARMGDTLAGIRGDNAQLAECIEKLSGVEKSIYMRIEEVETTRSLWDSPNREGMRIDSEGKRNDGGS